MKDLYKSPIVTVEELTKVDVLCVSSGLNDQNGPNSNDAGNPQYSGKLWENNAFDITKFM